MTNIKKVQEMWILLHVAVTLQLQLKLCSYLLKKLFGVTRVKCFRLSAVSRLLVQKMVFSLRNLFFLAILHKS